MNSRRRVRDFVRASLVLAVLSGPAAATEDLYVARVSADTTGVASDRDVSDAMRRVLRRVSGRRTLGSSAALDAAVADANAYLLSQRYEAGAGGQQITFTFDRNRIDSLLEVHSIRRWTGPRPTPLLWAAVERQGQRELVGATESPALASALTDVADSRGVRLIVPLLDLDDRARVTPEDVWGADRAIVGLASKRYGADALLMAKAIAENDVWRVDWELSIGERIERWAGRGGSVEEALAEGVQVTIDLLASDAPGPTSASVASPSAPVGAAPVEPSRGVPGRAVPRSDTAANASPSPSTPAPPIATVGSVGTVGTGGTAVATAPDVRAEGVASPPERSAPSPIPAGVPAPSPNADATPTPSPVFVPGPPATGEFSLGASDVQVSGVGTLADFVRAKRYLESLPIVQRVHLRRLEAGTVVFTLNVQGGLRALSTSVGYGGTLAQEDRLVDNRFRLVR
ncbi:MAG: DUF2066 domain-containing protein [Pseudomonadota bacterium]